MGQTIKLLCHFFQTAFFFVTHNVFFCHAKSLTLSPFSKLYLFTASSLLHLTAFLNKQSYYEWPQRPETTPEPRRFARAFGKNGANKASKEMDFPRWCGDKLFNKEKESEMVFWCFVRYFLCMHNSQSPRHESRLKQTACGCVICKC